MTIYVVTGSQRCGTSMMMKALAAGGLNPEYEPAKDKALSMKLGGKGYDPNGGGYYELRRHQYSAPRFPEAHEGRLIKVLNEGALRMVARSPSDPYRVVVMRRDPAAMLRSWVAMYGEGYIHSLAGPGLVDPDLLEGEGVDPLEVRLRLRRDAIIELLLQRPDCRAIIVDYERVVIEPYAVFDDIARIMPIDPADAAAIVDADQQRHGAPIAESGNTW